MTFFPAFAVLLAAAAGPPELAPGAALRFEFPELPATLAEMSGGKKQVPTLTATLPANYTREGRFPLFVYLLGGPGGRGDDPSMGRGVIGPDDFICVALPLFKRALDPSEPARGLMVSMDDYPVVSRAYGVMLRKLLDAVPNVTAERSTFGGHSNGAHTTAVLLAGQDEFLFAHFRAFYLHEGGTGPLLANVLHKRPFRSCRLLLMLGDRGPGGAPRGAFGDTGAILEAQARRLKLDFTSVVMRGYGHEQPPEYLKVIGEWARGEKLTEVPPRPARQE